jgi:hypothetical protein
VNDTFDLVLLSPEGCPPSQREVSAEYAALCLGDGSVFASVYGSRDFVSGVADGLVVEDFTQAT